VRPAAAIALALALLAGCGSSDRVEQIEAETKKLESERVEASVVTAAQGEADTAEQRLAATKKELELLNAEVQHLNERKRQLEAAIAREGELAAQAQTQTAALQQKTALELAEVDKKDEEIAAKRTRALWVRKQAAVLAREIRPGDPAWATARRVKSLEELVSKVSDEYPDDPVVAELAAQSERSVEDPAQAGALAAARAARLRDRFTRVYDLDTPEVAAGTKEPAPN